MNKKIIFNADDFGLSKGVNLGIIEAHQNGPVRSTTLMAGGVAFEHAVALAKIHPELNVGIHLTLTASRSVGGPHKTLTDENGFFLPLIAFIDKAKRGLLDLTEVEAEYEAQIQKVLDAGIIPTHFDSHHHTHFLPGVFDVFLKMAVKYNVSRVRISHTRMQEGGNSLINLADPSINVLTTDQFAEDFYGDGVTIDNLKRIIASFQGNTLEIMLHPAYIDYTLHKSSSYLLPRAYEVEILTSAELCSFLANQQVEIASFLDLP